MLGLFQAHSPFAAPTMKGGYVAVVAVEEIVDPQIHAQEAKLITQTVIAFRKVIAIRRARIVHERTVIGDVAQQGDREIDGITRVIETVVSRDLDVTIRAGGIPEIPNAISVLWPEGPGHYRSQRRVFQLAETDQMIRNMQEPTMFAYLDSLNLAQFIPQLIALNNMVRYHRNPADKPYSSDEYAMAKATAKDMYFRVCAAVMRLNVQGAPLGVQMFASLEADNDSYLAFRKTKLHKDATPEQGLEVDVAFEATLPELVQE